MRLKSTKVARNVLLLLFENFQTFNSRSERRSVFRQSLKANPFLAFGVAGAQAVHVAAMYVPGLNDTLHIAPVSFAEWIVLLAVASTSLIVMEAEKWGDRSARGRNRAAPSI